MRVLLLILLMASPAWGQLTVTQQAEVGEPILATIDTMVPEGADTNGPGWVLDAGTSMLPSSKPGEFHIWATPGKHVIRFKLHWLHTEAVTFTDGAGKEITIQSFLGHGDYDESAEFVVGEAGPDPGPDPPTPVPGGPYQIMMFYAADQLDDYPPEQRLLLTSLTLRKDLVSKGHVYLEALESRAVEEGGYPPKYQGFVTSISGDRLPRIAIASVKGGKVQDFPLPGSIEELHELLGGIK